MPDKIMKVLEEVLMKHHDDISSQDDDAIAEAHSQILEIFKEMVPKDKDYKRDWEDEPMGSLYGYKKALQDIRAKIMALTNNGGSDDPKE